MRIFVTGATGFIGSAVVRELLEAGHQVVGLARSDTAAAALTAARAEVHRGALDDLDSLRSGAAAADGVIHLAFMHDFADYAGAGATDLRAVATIGAALVGSGKPFVVTSGTWVLPPGRVGREEDAPDPGSAGWPRIASENAAIALAERGVRSSVVRLAPSVHGPGDHGFVPTVVGIARETGVSAVVGYGANRWPAVHRLDAARLFRLALESAPAGSRLHGVADDGVPFGDIADVIARRLNLPVLSISRREADIHFGWLSAVASVDNPTSSTQTQELLGWRPVHPALIPDLEEGQYFRGLGAHHAEGGEDRCSVTISVVIEGNRGRLQAMCRLFGMSGGDQRVRATFWLLEAPDSLARQSRREPDGTGVGWYDAQGRPAIAKQPLAAYEDQAFAREARELESTTFVAHIRYATTGAVRAVNTHPFAQHGRLFAHNGVVQDLPRLERELGDGLSLVHGGTDSERVFALITRETERHDGDVGAGISSAARWITANLPVYALNLVVATRDELWALRYPDVHELWVLGRDAGGAGGEQHLDAVGAAGTVRVRSEHLARHPSLIVASEVMDTDPGWRPLASGELLHVDRDLVAHSTIALPEPPAHPLSLQDLEPRAAAAQAPPT